MLSVLYARWEWVTLVRLPRGRGMIFMVDVGSAGRARGARRSRTVAGGQVERAVRLVHDARLVRGTCMARRDNCIRTT